MRVLPCDCEASHVAVAGQPLQLLPDSARKARVLLRPNRFQTSARGKFAQKLLGLRRDVIARIFAKQFTTKPTERRVIVDVQSARQFREHPTPICVARTIVCSKTRSVLQSIRSKDFLVQLF